MRTIYARPLRYRELSERQKEQVAALFSLTGSLSTDDYLYEITSDGQVLSRARRPETPRLTNGGTMTLTKLREDLIGLELQIAALEKAQGETKKAAKERYADHANGDPEAHRDLEALNQAYLDRQAEIDGAALRFDALREQIAEWYESRKPVDWTFRLVPGSLWDGWSNQKREGREFVIDKELTEVEIEAIKKLTGFKKMEIERHAQGYRLRARTDIYRGVCWDDASGEGIRKALLRWFEPEAKAEAALFDLAVLK